MNYKVLFLFLLLTLLAPSGSFADPTSKAQDTVEQWRNRQTLHPMNWQEIRTKAAQGDARSELQLGWTLYWHGIPEEKIKNPDRKQGLELILKSANQGYTEAQAGLSGIYASQDPTDADKKHDWVEAYFWSCLAAHCHEKDIQKMPYNSTTEKDASDLSHSGAELKALDDQKHLTRDQIEAVKKRARAWKPTLAASTKEKTYGTDRNSKKQQAQCTRETGKECMFDLCQVEMGNVPPDYHCEPGWKAKE